MKIIKKGDKLNDNNNINDNNTNSKQFFVNTAAIRPFTETTKEHSENTQITSNTLKRIEKR